MGKQNGILIYTGRFLILVLISFLLFQCSRNSNITAPTENNKGQTVTKEPSYIIPLPVSDSATGKIFNLTSSCTIYVEPASDEIKNIGQYLADKLNPATGFNVQVRGINIITSNRDILLTTENGDPSLGDEGYKLIVTEESITLQAYKPEGLFRGIQTIRMLLPPSIEKSSVQQGPWQIDTRIITDYPRFRWRGAMLDVARHFFKVQDVEHYIDLLAYYKIDMFHLHLSDDQGWRIAINSWPNLALHGGSSAVNGDPGGYYTQSDFTDIVNYAKARYITVIPEIDMPGHVNAALASYAELNCSGVAPPLYTGINVGFSSLCVDKDITYTFLNDVIKELAAITPGPYIHIGGDEARTLSSSEYITFVNKVQNIVQTYGKQMIGWEETAQANLLPGSIVQHWATASYARSAAKKGNKIIMSPSSKAYMDMKYNSSTTLGQNWAGYIEVQTAYNWDPATQISGVSEKDILGIEAPLWTETIKSLSDIEYMAFPRIICYAEIGWTQENKRNWDDFNKRLSLQGPRLDAMDVNYYKSPQIDWIK